MSDSAQKKSKIPYFFVAFFAVVVCVDSFYIYLSRKSWRGVATENSYQKGLKYNQTIEEASKQRLLGWKAEIKHRRIDDYTIEIAVDLRDKNSAKISDAAVEISFRRPAQEGHDFAVKAAAGKVRGRYAAKVDFPLLGQWDAEITAKKDEKIFVKKQRFLLE